MMSTSLQMNNIPLDYSTDEIKKASGSIFAILRAILSHRELADHSAFFYIGHKKIKVSLKKEKTNTKVCVCIVYFKCSLVSVVSMILFLSTIKFPCFQSI